VHQQQAEKYGKCQCQEKHIKIPLMSFVLYELERKSQGNYINNHKRNRQKIEKRLLIPIE